QPPTITLECSNKSATIYYYLNDKKSSVFVYDGEPIDLYKKYLPDSDMFPGKYTFTITYHAELDGEKEEPKTYEIKMNAVNPEIVLQSPTKLSFTTTDPTVKIDGRVTLIKLIEKGKDALWYDAKISINSENIPVNPDDGSFQKEYNLKPGHNSIKVIAEDLSGRTKEISINVFYETYVTSYSLLLNYDSQEIYINDELIPDSENTLLTIMIGRTMIPLDFFTGYFPIKEQSNDETRSVILTYKNTSIKLTQGSSDVIINGSETHTCDFAPFYRSGKLCLPLRFIFETFGGEVSWNSTTRDINIEIDM
ncbi:MAG: copper amine oxidase N-terminal domain-containing protein, partial [Chlamydiia bacterium]|nr:copper amine oxidase N-terminal domain-containing protein [Chlamydiia bacterium]